MFLNCPHCKKDMEPAVLTDTLEDKQATNKTKAICVECMKELSLSIYTLKMLVNLKQFYSKPKSGAAFSFFCKTCNKNLQAILSPDKTKGDYFAIPEDSLL